MKCENHENPVAGIHIGNEIAGVMERERYSPSWLARVLFCDRTNIYKIMRKSTIDTALLMRISIALHHDFFRLYSERFAKITTEENKNCETHVPQFPHHKK